MERPVIPDDPHHLCSHLRQRVQFSCSRLGMFCLHIFRVPSSAQYLLNTRTPEINHICSLRTLVLNLHQILHPLLCSPQSNAPQRPPMFPRTPSVLRPQRVGLARTARAALKEDQDPMMKSIRMMTAVGAGNGRCIAFAD